MEILPDPITVHRAPLRVALLGSTGSIGRQTLDVLEAAGPGAFRVVALAAGRDARTLLAQAARHRPAVVALADAAARAGMVLPTGSRLEQAPDAVERLATRDDVDMVIVATGGIVSLRAVLAALRAGKVVATANKETLVAGGHLVMPLARALAATVAASRPSDPMASPLAWLRPIDSEHSALWQCLAGERAGSVARLILTASGGPFRGWEAGRLATATAPDALTHPTWDMGAKITIDSATLMNKGLEVIEARWLYDVDYERIDVLIHPQSLVHSLVEFIDGSVKAQLGLPDMRIPIQYAVTFPHRVGGPAPRLDLLRHPELTFEAPDLVRFPALRIAREAGREGPRATAALIAADEVAVSRFLEGSLTYPGMARMAEDAVARFGPGEAPGLEELIDLDKLVRAACADADQHGGEPEDMIDGLIDVVLLLAILVGLVVIHELGHFAMARRANVKVHEFGVGFPPRARILHRGKETIYSLNWLPIGGFVRLEGEEGESSDPRAFVNQRLRTRLVILAAGVIMNFLLAWLIFTLIAGLADPIANVRVASVQPGSPAAAAGLVGGLQTGTNADGTPIYDASGDLIIAIDGQRFSVFDNFGPGDGSECAQKVDAPLVYLCQHAGQAVTLTVRHPDGTVADIFVTLRSHADAIANGALGIGIQAHEREDLQRAPLEAVRIGLQRTIDASTLILRGLRDLVTQLSQPPVSGPIGIVTTLGMVRTELPPVFLFWLIGLLSANLAVVNILPFPPMDGGRMAMALAKAVSGNRITPNAERTVYLVGFMALMALLAWITVFDIQRLGGG